MANEIKTNKETSQEINQKIDESFVNKETHNANIEEKARMVEKSEGGHCLNYRNFT